MKKYANYYLIFFLFPIFTFAQGNSQKTITLSSQNQIDSFSSTYPELTDIEGNIYISGENITNLDSLYTISSISDSLMIYNCNNLLRITGLSNMTSVHSLFLFNSNKLTSLKGLERITSFETLKIQYMSSLENLEGLNNLEKIFLEFMIKDNSNLVDISSINKLYNLNHIYIGYNPRLKTLNGLQSVLFCDMGIDIGDNDSLIDISFSNIAYSKHISLLRNPLLTNVIFSNLSELKEYLVLGRNYNLSEVGDFNQLQSADYLSIWRNSQLKNINGLNELINIETGVYFAFNDSLESITGLNGCTDLEELTIKENLNLRFISGFENLYNVDKEFEIFNNAKLNLISAFGALNRIGGSFSLIKNYQLSSIIGFRNLRRIGYDLLIQKNYQLQNLTGLNSLISVNGDLNISDNLNLKNLNGLENLNIVKGMVGIISNNSLNSLSGFENVSLPEKKLYIYENPKLSICNTYCLCDFLNENSGSFISIFNNASGCDSEEEVLETCELSGAFDSHVFPMKSDQPKWNVLELATSLPNIGNTYSYTYESDTIFCGNKYSITKLDDMHNRVYIRSTPDKAYFRIDNNCNIKEYLLYDYHLSIGDTAWVGMENNGLAKDTMALVLSSVDSILQFGKYRRLFNMEYAEEDQLFEGSLKWIEGIGSEVHPFYPFAKLETELLYDYSLLCYDSSWIQLYQNPFWNICDTNYIAIDELDQNDFSITPNPFKNQFRISSNTEKIQKVRIYSSSGIFIQQYILQNSLSTKVVLNNKIPAGLYIIQVFTKSNMIQRKILKL